VAKNWILVKLLKFKEQLDSLKRIEIFKITGIFVGIAVIPAASEIDPPSVGLEFVKEQVWEEVPIVFLQSASAARSEAVT
jgi:hypothetical protein